MVEGLGAALGAAHGHGALDGRDDERRELSGLIGTGAVLAQRVGEQGLPCGEDVGGGREGGRRLVGAAIAAALEPVRREYLPTALPEKHLKPVFVRADG